MYAEQADVDSVFVDGQPVKRHGRLLFAEPRMRELKERLLASRARLFNL
jgi:hypothetical protein